MHRWFGVSLRLSSFSSGLFIPPSCAVKVKLAPFTKKQNKTLRSYLGDPVTLQPLQWPAGERKRALLPWEDDNRAEVCVRVSASVCESSTIKVVYLLPDCPNTCDNIQWTSSTLEHPRDPAEAAQCGWKVTPQLLTM